MNVNNVAGKVIPSPKLAGIKNKPTSQFGEPFSINRKRKFPKAIKKTPAYSRICRQLYLLMQIPVIKPPTGVNNEGMVKRSPALAVESPNTIWKNKGSVKRYA